MEEGRHAAIFHAMACRCEVRLAQCTADEAIRAAGRVVDEVRRIESKFSRYQADSVLSRINAQAGKAGTAIDEETASLLRYAQALYDDSDGLFDITSGVLRRAWDFKGNRLPASDVLDALLPLVDYSKVELDDRRVRLPIEGMEIDFGGFGKEYAADRAATLAESIGIQEGFVDLGGDIRTIGKTADTQPFVIGIAHPREGAALVASVLLSQGAVCTSGDYERFMEIEGERYCHILNPRTGYPVRHWQSVTVFAPVALAAGSMTTIAMLKEAEGLDYLESQGLAFLAIDQAGRLHRAPVGGEAVFSRSSAEPVRRTSPPPTV